MQKTSGAADEADRIHTIESVRTYLSQLAATLRQAEELTAKSLVAAGSTAARSLQADAISNLASLLKAQEATARKLLASQTVIARLLKSDNEENVAALPGRQQKAASDLLVSQSMVAELLRKHDTENSDAVLEAQKRAAENLVASQAEMTKLLRLQNLNTADALLEAQKRAASDLLASQSAVAELLSKHNKDMASLQHLSNTLDQLVMERTRDLTESNAQLEEATRAKSAFLASMSHELRTPLNTIIGFSHLLATGMVGDLEPEQQKQVHMIYEAGVHLLKLVNEVLDLSTIEAGHVHVEHEQVDVHTIVSRVGDSLAVLAEAKGLDFVVKVHRGAQAITSDATRLEQVLFNLLGNAIKFTESGSVRLDVRREDALIVFAVSDTGRGIAPKDLEPIFDEFYQVDRPDLGKSEGTGLGLSVSAHLVELLGGTLSAASEPDKGSTFTARIPIE